MNKREFWLKIFISTGLLLLLSVATVYLDSISLKVIGSKKLFQKIDQCHYQADISKLPKGTYVVSLGRPRGACSVMKDASSLYQTVLVSDGIKQEISPKIHFRKNDGDKLISIQCLPQSGFSFSFSYSPVILDIGSGNWLHMLRDFILIYLGPICSLLLILSIFTDARTYKALRHVFNSLSSSDKERFAILFFAVVSFVYCLSLAHFMRLFWSGTFTTTLHIYLRILYSLAFVTFIGTYSKFSLTSISMHGAMLALTAFIQVFDPSNLVNCYVYFYPFFVLATAFGAWYIFNERFIRKNYSTLQVIALTWGISQLIDTVSMFSSLGVYTAQTMIAVIALCVFYFTNKSEMKVGLKISAMTRILDSIYNSKNIKESLVEVGTILLERSGFSRLSIYVDDYCFGLNTQLGNKARRIYEFGYEKDTSIDSQIDFLTGKGGKMVESSKQGNITLQKGDDNSYYCIIPIGSVAWINLSDNKYKSNFHILESETSIKSIMSNLGVFSEKLIEYALKESYSIEKIKSSFGIGEHKLILGSVFIDIIDYSYNNHKYGAQDNEYVKFVDKVYFPALIKSVLKYAIPERFEGDEIYLIVTDKLNNNFENIAQRSALVVEEIVKFINTDGAVLCSKKGYPPISMSISLNVGEANLVCDQYSIRSSGASVNISSRLLQVCPKGKIMVSNSLAERFLNLSLKKKKEINLFVKKDYIRASIFEYAG
ncbi:MAG: hypothetical protein HYV97_01285 [Bdellovibrio sp.]|nr:hypothetical protein [Bdellovibrio sp.]